MQKQYLYLVTRDQTVTGLPVAIWANSAREAADEFARIKGWGGDMLVQQVIGARQAQMQKEVPLWMGAR